ncbi:hydrolase [Leucosporidium creatinivorum]|uniref:Hydrolase n=1 Tax=Leucosporidium creatinivorum TaxID=106004 RepID=A0A1Y2FXQ2_9BASI|nr:hydrolase [Leucosporidium creatinivorum]
MAAKSKSKSTPVETALVLPRHADIKETEVSSVELVDTHTHVASTFEAYRAKYPEGAHTTIKSFVKALLMSDETNKLSAVVDVWCEAPLKAEWLETVDSLGELKEEGLSYSFVVGAHPHEAKEYTDELEETFKKAHAHPLCVGWGEIGLDYHYDNSPREIQQAVLRRQLRTALASGLGKAITIHTREADDDIYTILTEELPKEQRIHVHCFTDSLEVAVKLLDHFPNLYIGITGVITYSSNLNTSQVVRHLGEKATPSSPSALRLVLETDAPYMLPSTMGPPSSFGMTSKQKLPFAHSAVLPWTAAFVAKVLNEREMPEGEAPWTTEDVLRVARENARKVYGV